MALVDKADHRSDLGGRRGGAGQEIGRPFRAPPSQQLAGRAAPGMAEGSSEVHRVHARRPSHIGDSEMRAACLVLRASYATYAQVCVARHFGIAAAAESNSQVADSITPPSLLAPRNSRAIANARDTASGLDSIVETSLKATNSRS